MFVVHEDMTIYATRGDAVYFPVEKTQGDMKYQFQPGDIVRFKVFEKKNCSKVVLMKDFLVEAEATAVNIFLSRFDMKFGEIINKPVDYWYEVELNPDTNPDTFIGYNEDGPAIFKLFPEAKDVVEGEIPDPEENSAVSRMVVTFVNEYMGQNAQDIVNESIAKYIEEHPIVNGEDGIGVASAYINDSGYLVITYTNGSNATVGRVVGANGKDGKNGRNGYTFTPKVDAEGNLSWTNDGGLENPAVANIRGPKGEKGGKGDTGERGADGKSGSDGKDGADGYTPVKGVDYYTEAEKAALVEEVVDSMNVVTSIDFTNFKDGSFTEIVDGEMVTHTVTFDGSGDPSSIDGISLLFPEE